MYKNILLPFDGSEHSKRATEAAIGLCTGNETLCKITLLHVHLPVFSSWAGAEMTEWNKESEIAFKKSTQELLDPVLNSIYLKGIDCDSEIILGDPAKEICRLAKSGNYDLIVMGSRGLGTFKEILLGSVSHKVIQNTTCNVLIVK